MSQCSQCGADNDIGYLNAALDRKELLYMFEDKLVKALEYFHVCSLS